MDAALSAPQPCFHLIKAMYPHAFHGTSRDGSLIFIEKAGAIGALARGLADAGIPAALAALHLAYINEFIAQRLDSRPLPAGRVVRIVDVGGLSLTELASGPVREFLSAAAAILSPFYPERAAAIFIVNAPAGFSLAFALVSPLCAARTLSRVTVVGAGERQRMAEVLCAAVAPEALPREYGGTCDCGGAEAGGCWRRHATEEALWREAERTTPKDKRLPLTAVAAAGKAEGRAEGPARRRRAPPPQA
jgi:hypothetical protein